MPMQISKVPGTKGGNQVIMIYSKCVFSGTRKQCEKYVTDNSYGLTNGKRKR